MFSLDLRDPPRLAIFANTIFDLRELTQLEKSTKTSIFDRQICAIFPAGSLSHFARSFPKSRAKCRITLRDNLYESCWPNVVTLAARGKPSTLFPRERLVELVVTTNKSTTHVATPIARAHR